MSAGDNLKVVNLSRSVRVALAAVALTCGWTAGTAEATTSGAAQPEARGSDGGVVLRVNHVSAAGTDIAWAQVGAGEPLVLLNGTGSPMSEWDPALLGGLAKRNRVIVFDYPGLAASGRPPGPMSIDKLADWTAAFIQSLGISPINVFGWSMGGFVAQRLAIRHPALIDHLVLAATNPGGPKTSLGPQWVQRIDSDPGAGDRAFLKTNFPRTRSAQRAGRGFIRRIDTAISAGRYPDNSVDPRMFRAMVAAEDSWLRAAGNLVQLRQITRPTLIIDGDRDVVTPPTNSRFIARRIVGSRLRYYRGAGHAFLFQQPAKVGRDVSAFLAS